MNSFIVEYYEKEEDEDYYIMKYTEDKEGNSDRHRRDLIKRAGRYCLAADLPAPLWEVIFIWIITGS